MDLLCQTSLSWASRSPTATPRAGSRASSPRFRIGPLLEGTVADLADPLARDAEQGSDLLQCPLFTVVEAVVEIEDLPLPLGQVLLEHCLEEVATSDGLHVLFDVGRLGTGKALAEAGAVTVAAVNGGVETQFGSRHASERADGVDRLFHLLGDLLIGGSPAKRLGQLGIRARELRQVRVLIERDAYGACLLRQRLEDGLADPPNGVGNEFYALVGIELLHRLEKTLVADAHELGQAKAPPLVLLHVGDDEAEVRSDQTFGCFLVTDTRPTGKLTLFARVLNEGVLLYVLQVLIERIKATGGRKHPYFPFLVCGLMRT